ncbi:gamma-mobile-trio protein GmtX [Paralcaligenes ureilyticus]|uniref:Uncharacterized protein n=1 Tax=Paralcaligenes ureilyticus TaxID=627131 RepID=A0A4V2UYD9_9BURK|nr:gamma-mobile-trio protein GmtX [Paralcaligenes ureilyticus]TCT07018.1 hypothetical protein EDC26_10774 [Paralcaligenes ureilyticus]
MYQKTNVHPDEVLEAILTVSVHPTKKRNLALIHQICFDSNKIGNKDFSLKSIGQAIELQGGLKAKSLWNAQSSDYRKLIEAWQAYVGPIEPDLREIKRTSDDLRLSQNIPDPAIRIIVEKLVKERNSLRAELNILKAQSTVIIDRRSSASVLESRAEKETGITVQVLKPAELNQLETEALAHAISPDLWHQEGWVEQKLGRVVMPIDGTDRSRTIFKPGFVSAVKKLLAA